jgi:uncharacterized protein YbjQ (UPF0145 family)
MSYQRAVVNCRLCYQLAAEIGEFKEVVAQARNEAMKALEKCATPLRIEDSLKIGAKEAMKENVEITRALTACMNCDYKQAKIAEIFDPNDGSV